MSQTPDSPPRLAGSLTAPAERNDTPRSADDDINDTIGLVDDLSVKAR